MQASLEKIYDNEAYNRLKTFYPELNFDSEV